MSRIGKKLIELPSGVTVQTGESTVTVNGPKGTLNFVLTPEIAVEQTENTLQVKVIKTNKRSSALMGLTRSYLANMVKGVVEGYEKKLELVGVGYRAKQNGRDLTLSVGYSHPVEFKVPEGISVEVDENQNIVVKGIDKQLVGQVAANIRKVRKPEPYKGKGIKYLGEVVRRKQGKTGKV